MSALDSVFSKPQMTLDAEDDVEAINRLYQDRGWSDGLPIIPPTTERVERMLEYCDRPLEEPILKVPPRHAPGTPLRIAANAVMAGCRPEYFPLVLATLEAMNDPALNLYGVQATTHPCTTVVLFNGPLAREVGVNSGHNAFGPGFAANATIGRAVRLALFNIGGAISGTGDMATVGTPAKFTFCAAENEAANPWGEPYHVELGYPADASTVTIVGAEGPHNINDHESTTGEGILKTIAGTIAMVGSNNAHHPSTPILALGPEHAATIHDGGYSKKDVKAYLYEQARLPITAFSKENAERRLMRRFPERFSDWNATVPMAHTPDDFIVMVIGGAGKHSAYIPTFGGTRAVTSPIKLRDGSLATSISQFKKA